MQSRYSWQQYAVAADKHQPWRPRCLTASLRTLIGQLYPKGCKGKMAVVHNMHCLDKHNDAARMAHHGGVLPWCWLTGRSWSVAVCSAHGMGSSRQLKNPT